MGYRPQRRHSHHRRQHYQCRQEDSPDGRTVFVHNPNTSTRVTTRSASGDTLSITGTAVTPEFHTYGILPDGTRWSRTVQGETASSPRFTKRYENLLGQTILEERSGFQGAVLATTHAYDSLGRRFSISADCEPVVEYTYDLFGNRVATTKMVGRAVPSAPQSPDIQWRKSETSSSFAIANSLASLCPNLSLGNGKGRVGKGSWQCNGQSLQST